MKESLCDRSGALVFDLSPELTIRNCNPAALKLMAYPREGLIGQDWVEFCICPSLHDRCRQILKRFVEGSFGPNLHRQAKVRDAEGRSHDLLCQIVREGDDAGRCTGLLLTAIEETAFAESRKARSDEDRMLANLIANLPGTVYRCLLDANWTMVYLSDGVLELTGYPPGALLQNQPLSYAQLIVEEDRKLVKHHVNVAIAEKRPYELRYRIRKASGEEAWVWERGRAIFRTDETVEALEGVITDISAQVHAQEALLASEESYRSLVEQSPDGIGVHQGKTLLMCNEAMCKILRRSRGELCAMPLLDLIHPDDRDLARDRIHRNVFGREHGPLVGERLLRGDGTVAMADVIALPTVYRGEEAVQVIVRDLSEKHRIEEQLRRSQKMEAIGTLAGGLAHDFNNLLSVILGYADLLDGTAGLTGDPLSYVEEIRKASERAQSLTRQLLAFSRRQDVKMIPLDLDDLLRDLERMLRRLIGENVELDIRPHGQLPLIRGDEAQLHQILLNLAINARDAITDVGHLRIRSDHLDLDATEVHRLGELQPGPHVLLEVSDTGRGMTNEVVGHIFEPFYTTKSEQHGTGLGLATVYGIVKRHGGTIDVRSEPGKGSCFSIYLPVCPDELSGELPRDADRTSKPADGTETVLIVEDDVAVRHLASRILRARGYRVIEVEGPHEALLLMERGDQSIDLLLTDVIMPRMNGRELAERLVELSPELTVLYMSGYADDILSERGLSASTVHFLPKPFTISSLTRAVRKALES